APPRRDREGAAEDAVGRRGAAGRLGRETAGGWLRGLEHVRAYRDDDMVVLVRACARRPIDWPPTRQYERVRPRQSARAGTRGRRRGALHRWGRRCARLRWAT